MQKKKIKIYLELIIKILKCVWSKDNLLMIGSPRSLPFRFY